MPMKFVADQLGIRRGRYRMIRNTLAIAGAVSHIGPALGLFGNAMPQLVEVVLGTGIAAQLTYGLAAWAGVDWLLDEYNVY